MKRKIVLTCMAGLLLAIGCHFSDGIRTYLKSTKMCVVPDPPEPEPNPKPDPEPEPKPGGN